MTRNSTAAFYEGLEAILTGGKIIKVRDREVKEIVPCYISISRPLERVLIAPYRANNIFATIAETIWVIAGRNDLDFLQHYLPIAKEFSDDGLVWRAGYGSRLRKWQGKVDQIHEVLKTLLTERNSRRAVMVIFNPSDDFVDSRDIPCNNWLQFIVRDNLLYLNIAVRSNDIVWGFSGINTFEWGVLQEMMAHWLGAEVGSSHYLIGSFHLYDNHYTRAQQIITHRRDKFIYDFGFNAFRFHTPFENMEQVLLQWFEIEHKSRENLIDVERETEIIEDEFLRYSLYMVVIYNQFLQGACKDQIFHLILGIPLSDFRIAAIEYFSRKFGNIDFQELKIFSDQELRFLRYFWEGEE